MDPSKQPESQSAVGAGPLHATTTSNASNLLAPHLGGSGEALHPASPAWLTAAQRESLSGASIPATVPPRTPTPVHHSSSGTLDDAEKNAIEVKKNEKVLIAGREEIEKITKQRKLKFSDLITIKPTGPQANASASNILIISLIFLPIRPIAHSRGRHFFFVRTIAGLQNRFFESELPKIVTKHIQSILNLCQISIPSAL